jgi:oligopeptide transport system substrate-binding protein
MTRIYIFTIITLCIMACHPDGRGGDRRTAFRYNESKGISTLDPAFARNQILTWPVYQLYNGLLDMDDSLRLQPSIAKTWKVSADGLTYTFCLRNDVYFHPSTVFPRGKGRKVVASDFVYSFTRILDPKTASPGTWVFNDVSQHDSLPGFTAVNDTILQIHLRIRFAAFAQLLTMPYCYVLPREVVEHYGNDFRSHPVGTGPFMLKTWREGEKLVLVKNPDYFERDVAGKRLPYLDAVAITFINDKQSEFLEFMKGNLDFLSGVQAAYRNELLTRNGKLNPKYAKRFVMGVTPYLNTEYLGFMVEPGKIFNNPLVEKKVRLAINVGFDRDKMLKYLRNKLGVAACFGFIPKGMPGYTELVEGAYHYDPDLSRKLLADAGYPNGKGLPEITLTATTDYLDLCEFIQHELSQIGIRMKIEVSDGATFRGMVANSKLQFFRSSWIADYPDAENYLSLFYSPNQSPKGANYTHFQNKAYDRLYEKAISETNETERLKDYRAMNQILLSEAPVVPLYYDMAVRFTPANITGFQGNPINVLKLKTVRKIL